MTTKRYYNYIDEDEIQTHAGYSQWISSYISASLRLIYISKFTRKFEENNVKVDRFENITISIVNSYMMSL